MAPTNFPEVLLGIRCKRRLIRRSAQQLLVRLGGDVACLQRDTWRVLEDPQRSACVAPQQARHENRERASEAAWRSAKGSALHLRLQAPLQQVRGPARSHCHACEVRAAAQYFTCSPSNNRRLRSCLVLLSAVPPPGQPGLAHLDGDPLMALTRQRGVSVTAPRCALAET